MQDLIKRLAHQNDKKIVLLVMDGLGGLPKDKNGKTELETARTPNLDKLASESECGLHLPIDYGITPGSAPGHLAPIQAASWRPLLNWVGSTDATIAVATCSPMPGMVISRLA